MKFKSLSVIDFMEEYQNWSKTEFLPNVKHHIQELRTLETSDTQSLLFGCRHEIQHLIEFLHGVLEYNSTGHIPVSSDDDYLNLRAIFDGYFGPIKPLWPMDKETKWTPPFDLDSIK